MDDLTVFELRDYLLRPGRRDELIELFDRELLAPQEACGMRILGQFRDLDAPDRFVWIRAFRDLETRKKALTAFYEGPAWARFGPQAAATMIDSSDARLLRPLRFDPVAWSTPTGSPVFYLADPTPAALAVFTTLNAPNDFPRLPIRTDHLLAGLGREEIPGARRLAPTSRSLLR